MTGKLLNDIPVSVVSHSQHKYNHTSYCAVSFQPFNADGCRSVNIYEHNVIRFIITAFQGHPRSQTYMPIETSKNLSNLALSCIVSDTTSGPKIVTFLGLISFNAFHSGRILSNFWLKRNSPPPPKNWSPEATRDYSLRCY